MVNIDYNELRLQTLFVFTKEINRLRGGRWHPKSPLDDV